MENLLSFENLVGLLTLTAMEIVLGIDNIVFLAILTGKLPAAQQAKARRIGLFLAMFMRIGLLLTLSWIMRLTQPLFAVLGHAVSGRDLILRFTATSRSPARTARAAPRPPPSARPSRRSSRSTSSFRSTRSSRRSAWPGTSP
jgi:predicted tellurium resistance membrane protein TerC